MNTLKNIPHSPACDRNKQPILEILKLYLANADENNSLLEIGHGTGQHARFFSHNLSLNWYPSDVKSNNWMLKSNEKEIKNLHSPLALEVGLLPLNQQISHMKFDFIYTANTLHIMSESCAKFFCDEVHTLLNEGGMLFLYGPFKFNQSFTSKSNEQFDQNLKAKDSKMGIRDFEMISKHLENNKIELIKNHQMPANNNLLVFQKK